MIRPSTKYKPKHILAAVIGVSLLGWVEVAAVHDVPPVALIGCTPPKTVNEVQDFALEAGKLACILGGLGGDLIDPEAIAKICHITNALDKAIPFIRNLVGVREAAKRAPEGRVALQRFVSASASSDAGTSSSDAGASSSDAGR